MGHFVVSAAVNVRVGKNIKQPGGREYRSDIYITPVFSSTSRLFNVIFYPHVNSSADYEMPHFRAILQRW